MSRFAWLIPSRSKLRQKEKSFASAIPRVLNSIFWFLVLASWLPLLAGFENIISQLDPFSWFSHGAGRKIAVPLVLPFAAIAILILLIGLTSSATLTGPVSTKGPARYSKGWIIAIIGFVPAFLAALIAALSGSSTMAAETNYLTTTYLIAVLLSVFAFVCFAHIRSWYTGVFLALAAIEAISGWVSDTPILTFGRLFSTYALSAVDVFFFAIVIVFARFLVLVVKQNIDVFKELLKNKRRLLEDMGLAVWLWFPMLVIFLSLNYFWSTVEAQLDEYLGALMVAELPGAPKDPSFEDALKFTTAYASAEAAKKSMDAIKATDAQAKSTVADLINSGLPAIRASFPPYLMKPANCRWYDVFCHVMNGIRSVVNSVYRKARDVALSETERQVRASQQLMELRSTAAVSAANQQIDLARQQTSQWTGQATTKIFATARQIAFLLAIYSAVMLLKTYFVVLARVAFREEASSDKRLIATLRTPWKADTQTTHAPSLSRGNEFVMKNSDRGFYIATSFELRNAVAAVSLPQPFTAVLSRLIAGRYVFAYLDTLKLQGEATIAVNSPNTIVEWQLDAGEEVVVQYRDIVAFSSDIRLATEISVAIPALIFGRFIFHKVIGPGVLVVRTGGKAVAGRSDDTVESRRPTALKAWDINAGFQIQSRLSIAGNYLASYNIRKQEDDHLVYDTTPQNKPARTLGLASAIRIFLMPF
jgi:Mitochondrial biogenesis AIM24